MSSIDINEKNKYLISLYLEQIRYLRQEYVSIQNSFLAATGLPVTALGILVYYIENTNKRSVHSLYLFLPFLFSFVPYNIIKYTIRMMGINRYIKKLEKKINGLVGAKIFLWNSELINIGFIPGGFAMVTMIPQIPIYIAIAIYIFYKFNNAMQTDVIFKPYHTILWILLIIDLFGMACMLLDIIYVPQKIMKKVDFN